VIIPDINLLVYAYNADAPYHEAAKQWWERLLSKDEPVGLPWAVILGFVRLMTHPRVVVDPLAPADALAIVRSWVERPSVELLDPGPRHLSLLGKLLEEAGVAGSLTTDAHIAALAMEHRCTVCTTDADFARFSGVRTLDPTK
jgi:toxin-antitoxin system PIN domain toxin